MKTLLLISIITALFLLSGPIHSETPTPAAEKPTLNQLSWLAGHWQGGSQGRLTEEIWLPPAGGLMLGLNRDVSQDGKAFFEFLRLEQTDEGIFYHASPGGGETTSFKMTECSRDKAAFENKAHDFPQRITYLLTGPDSLKVTIEGDVKGKTESRSWSWTRLIGAASATGGGDR